MWWTNTRITIVARSVYTSTHLAIVMSYVLAVNIAVIILYAMWMNANVTSVLPIDSNE